MKHVLFAVALFECAALAVPLDCSPDRWDWSPIAWHFDAARGAVRSCGSSSLAVRDVPRCAQVSMSAKVTPVQVKGQTWATLGLALMDDARNFWHVALVQAPPEEGAGHFFELVEMREGKWLSQHRDHLVLTRHRVAGSWSFGDTYEISLSATPSGIAAQVKNAKGKTLFDAAYAFPTPTADGTVKAVTCGRPALHANGGFAGTFAALAADWSGPTPKVENAAAIPPYASESFVPGVTDKATGFFRVVEKDGRWWVIDPLGRGTVLLGVDHVTYRGHYSQRTKRGIYHEVNKARFPNKADWEADALARLQAWGFNLLGAGCDPALQHRGLIHTVFLSMGDGLCWEGLDPDFYICPNEHRPCSAFPNVFHPDFPAWADYQARRKCAPHRNDPWLFGYFIDNELAWWGRGAPATGLFDKVMSLPETHSAKVALRRFLREKNVTGTPSDEVKCAFLQRAADLYFRISSAAIRRHDPNHLVLGARFAGLGGAHPVVWETAGKYCDVVTFNCYPWADLDRNVVLNHRGDEKSRITEAFAKHYGLVKRPMLVTEWSFPALDSGLPCTGGAGQRFQTQALRTQATELFAKTMLSLPFLVGYDYFMWVDEPAAGISDAFPEDSNYGLVNERGVAYPEITAMFTKLHHGIGAARAAGTPPERPAPKAAGMTASAFLSRLNPRGVASYVRTGDGYVVRNAAGLELQGRVGGKRMFDHVRLNGADLGEYTGMWSDVVQGGLAWHDAGRVVGAEWRDGVLYVTCEGHSSKDRGMAQTHAITVFADRPWFLCDLVSAKNIGREPVEVSAFYFREYAPFARDKQKDTLKSVPNLWKAMACDAWIRAADGAYYGGASLAPTVAHFTYFVMNGGKSPHPDAMFKPDGALTLRPDETYAPKGRMWMLAVCGMDGVEGWNRFKKSMERLGR